MLFEDVMEDEMNDLDALGIDPATDEDLGMEEGDLEEGEPVTVTLSQDQVSVLRDILAQVDGGVEELGDDEGLLDDELGGDLGGDEFEDEQTAFEGIEAEVLGTPLVNQKSSGLDSVAAGGNKVKGKPTVSGKGSTAAHKFPKKTFETDEEGVPLVNQKDSGLSKVGPGSNKVKTTRTSTPNQDLFN